MTRQEVSDKKEKSLAEMIITGLLVSVLMMSFIYYFFKDESQITKAGYLSLANSFFAQVTTVHAQWYMENKPPQVSITVLDNTKQSSTPSALAIKRVIPVNKKGWVDVSDKYQDGRSSVTACQKIWKLLMEIPMSFMRQPIPAIEVKKVGVKVGRVCRYTITSGDFF
jgi:competence protein ComGC